MYNTFGDFILVLIAFGIGFLIGHGIRADLFEEQIIERGYGLYCPVDGEFAFKGECGDE